MKLSGDITIGVGNQGIKMTMELNVKMYTAVSDKSLVKDK